MNPPVGALGSFHLGATVNKAAKNILIQVFLCVCVCVCVFSFIFLRKIPRFWISGPLSRCVCGFIRNYTCSPFPTVIAEFYTSTKIYQYFSCFTTLPTFGSVSILNIAIWVDRKQYFILVLICISLVTKSIQFSSVTQSYPTLCGPMDCSTPGFPVQHQLPEFAQTHVHWVGDAIQPSHPLSSLSPPAFNLSQHQGLFPRSNSMKLWTMQCRATQDGRVMVKSSDKTWSNGEGNGKPLQYSCLENPMNSMKRPRILSISKFSYR